MESRKGELAVERLKRLVKTYNLGKVTGEVTQIKSSGNYIAYIKVGTHKFLTYPREFADQVDAFEYAAKEACAYYEQTPMWMQPAD